MPFGGMIRVDSRATRRSRVDALLCLCECFCFGVDFDNCCFQSDTNDDNLNYYAFNLFFMMFMGFRRTYSCLFFAMGFESRENIITPLIEPGTVD